MIGSTKINAHTFYPNEASNFAQLYILSEKVWHLISQEVYSHIYTQSEIETYIAHFSCYCVQLMVRERVAKT